MTSIQRTLLKMLEWFHNYCVKEGITYYAVGGTMIGALRHKGFIPWDDDIDIAIPRKGYDRLIRNFNGVIDGYLLESPYSGNSDYLYTSAKLYDTNTTLIEKQRTPCKRGVYLDIFPLDGLGDSLEESRQMYKKFDRKNMFLMTRICVVRNDRNWYKNASIFLARLIPSLFINEKKLSISIDKMAAEINRESSVYVANMMGSYRFREIVLREYFGKPTLYQFENIEIYGPEKYDEYLSAIYGDWRKLPPEDKRYTKHDYIMLDLDKSYLTN